MPQHILGHAGLFDTDPKLQKSDDCAEFRGAPHNGLAMLISRIKWGSPSTNWAVRFVATSKANMIGSPTVLANYTRPHDGKGVATVRKQSTDPSQHPPVRGHKLQRGSFTTAQNDDIPAAARGFLPPAPLVTENRSTTKPTNRL